MSTAEAPAGSAKYSEEVRNLHVFNTEVIDSTSATALVVGANGVTNPALQVDTSMTASKTGIKIKSAAAASGVAVSVISSGTDEALAIDAKGSGAITIGGVSTGPVRAERPLITKTTVTTQGTSTPQTLLAASIAGGIITQVPDGDTTDTTDTAANIISVCKLTANGDTVTCWLLNWSSNVITVQGGLNVTAFTTNVPGETGVQLVFRRTSATAVTLYVIGCTSASPP